MRKVLVVLATVAVAGCATTNDLPFQNVVTLSSGEKIEYVSVDAKDPSGMNSRVVDRYYKDPKTGQVALITKDGFSGQGWVNGFMMGGFAGLAQGAGLVGGAALLRPSSTNVNSNNGDGAGASGAGAGSSGAGAGGSIVNNNAATGTGGSSKAISKQTQGQAQTQIQNQSQKQKAYGGAGGAGGAGGSVNTSGGSISGGTTIKNSFNHNAVDVKGGIKDNTVNF